MFVVTWCWGLGDKVDRLYLGGYGQMFGSAVSTITFACTFATVEQAEAAMLTYAATHPELLGRFEIAPIKFKTLADGRRVPCLERLYREVD